MSDHLVFALPPRPPGIDLSETRVPQMYAALISTWVLAAVTLGLRAWVRRSRGGSAWWDDILAWMALVAATLQVFIVLGYLIPNGTGRHIWAGTSQTPRSWGIGLWINDLTYVLVLGLVKYSTLCLYWRVFAAEKRNRIPIWIMAGLVTGWTIAILIASIFQCFPVNAFWERFNLDNPMPSDKFNCAIDSKRFFIGTAIPTVITNLLLLALPVPYIWRLRMPTTQKIAILGVFLLGALVTVMSIVRLVIIIEVDLVDPDITWNIVNSIIWSNIECNIAVFCCCLPTLKPILDMFTAGTKAAERVGGRYVSRESRKTGGARHTGRLNGSTRMRTLQSTCHDQIPQWLDGSRCQSENETCVEVANYRTMTEIKAHRRPPPVRTNTSVVGGGSPGGLGRMGSLSSGPTLSRSRSLSKARLAKSRVSSEDDGGGPGSDVSSVAELAGITVTYDVVVSSERIAMGLGDKSPQLDQLRFSEMSYPTMKI